METTKAIDLERLKEIAELNVLSREVDEILDAASREAAEHLGLPIGVVSIVLDHAQYFAAHHGLSGWIEEAKGTPVEWAFCRFAVQSGEAFIVEDSHENDLVAKNPLVTQVGIRCYLGIPLTTSRGHVLGTLCVIGTEPRSFSDADVAYLESRARQVVTHIEVRAGRTV